MKRILLFVFALIMVMGFVGAEEQFLGTFPQYKCITLSIPCANCTYVNITSLILPNNGSSILNNVAMVKSGTDYKYPFCSNTLLGDYIYNTLGNPNGIVTIKPVRYTITPSGNSTALGLQIILFVLIYFIGFFGFFGKNVWVSIIGGLGMISLGVYTILNGFDMYRGFITDALSWITIGLGALFSLTAGVELIEENIL